MHVYVCVRYEEMGSTPPLADEYVYMCKYVYICNRVTNECLTSMCICVIVSRTNDSRVNAPCHTGLCMTLAATAMAARVHSHGIPCELLDSFMSVAKMLLKESVPTTAGFVYVCALQCIAVCCSGVAKMLLKESVPTAAGCVCERERRREERERLFHVRSPDVG